MFFKIILSEYQIIQCKPVGCIATEIAGSVYLSTIVQIFSWKFHILIVLSLPHVIM